MIKEVLLSTICDLKNGFAFKSKDYVDISNTLSCRMSSIRPGGNFDLEHNQRFLPDNYAKLYSDYLLSDGDIVIAMTDLAGDPKILGVPTIVKTGGKNLLQNQRVGKLVVTDSSKVFIPFLQYALNRPVNKSYYKKFAGGGLQINVSKKDILNNSVPLPPLDQQKKIAAILDAADAYRQKTKALITKYEELTQSLFLDMFGDPVSNPMGWEKSKADNHIDLLTGFAFKSKDYSKSSQDLKLCGGLIIMPWGIDWNKCNKWSPKNTKGLDKYWLNEGDIVMAMDRPWISSGFKINMLTSADLPSLLVQRTARIRSKSINIFFLYFLYNSKSFERQAKPTETTVPHISPKDIRNFQIPVPPIELQNQFADRVQAIEVQKMQAQGSLVQAEDLFNSLLQRAFKGELV
jgi:type I restriction enzyme S subunit